MSAGSMSGSSPWTFTTTSPSSARAATATRSVPLGRSDGVITARAPVPSTAAAMRSSSVATITSSRVFARRHASATQRTRGLPQMGARLLPGNRVEP